MKLPTIIFRDTKAPAFALLAAFIKHYGTAALSWEPEIIRKEIDEDFNLKLSDLQKDKLQAAITCLTTNLYETDYNVFRVVNHLFSNIHSEFNTFDILEAEELMNGYAEYMLIKESIDDDDIKFDPEVRAFAGTVFFNYGMSKAPSLFPVAIMPQNANDGEDVDKNEALTELFNDKVARIFEYLGV